MIKHIALFVICFCVAGMCLATKATAIPLYIEYNDYYVDDAVVPSGPTPWLTAMFESAGAGKVLLTLRATNLTGAEFVTTWYFNFTSGKPLGDLRVQYEGQLEPVSMEISGDLFSTGGGVDFPIRISYLTSNHGRFGEDSVSRLMFSGIDDLVPQDFNEDAVKGDELFVSVVKIQGTGYDGEGSAWLKGYDPPYVVPEPGTAVLMMLGLFFVGMWRFRGR